MLRSFLSCGLVVCLFVALTGCGSDGPKGTGTKKTSDNKNTTSQQTTPETSAGKSDVQPHSSGVDAGLKSYSKSSDEIGGAFVSEGSDTMKNLMQYWVESFRKYYPSVTATVEHKGSQLAPTALTKNQATFGAMSRTWKDSEIDDFKKAHGYEPTSVKTSIDMLAVYVHKDNPIAGLSLQQLDAIFSKSRKGGYAKDITVWGDLGLKGEWANQKINLYGRDASSGTYNYFKDHALFKGEYKDTINAAQSSAVVGTVSKDKFAIGYSGIGYKTADVKAVPIASEGEKYIVAEPKNAYSGEYPLARYLFLSLNAKPGEKLDPLRREFLKFVLSKEGQSLVEKGEYVPLTAAMSEEELKKLKINE